ncbi:hypothetical protein AVEN_220554-1 [Araneus ventricosus]|uniref:Integrase catalytic domain-containing protein n=1 Tax=Araneus ventricosus TaxID=182803 RepID=A0A4Y1ZT84_ARAVE|nr:hypothetical protein AVEN_220554-1 [Araneus ventricosus]
MCDSSDNKTFLLCSKSRVAPIKSVTIPTLELAACLLLAQLTRKVLNAFKLKIDQVRLWTDSTIALSWIETLPHLLKPSFINKCKKNSKECGAPSRIERQNAEIYILRDVQVRTFGNEIHSLEQCGNVTPNSKLKSLSLFLDSQGILRVGGRLRNSILPYNSKHPIIFPAKHKVTDMIIQYYHKIQFHSGPQALLYNIRQKFWPLNGRNLCRKIVISCVTCFKANPKISSQKMGDLSEERVNPNFVFNSVGIDFAGPFYIKIKFLKRDPPTKIYVCIIICLSTKAIHLELVSDLSSETLIEALKRFMDRRGKCRKILSDNATNFVGTKNEINRLFKLMEQQDTLFQNFLSEEEITWSHIPPRAPHHGGLWEVSVKSFKFYFKRVVSNNCLTYEEFLTILIQIEGLLISRPLTRFLDPPWKI